MVIRTIRFARELWLTLLMPSVLLLSLWIPLVAQAQTAALEATVERQTVIDGESVLLYIKGENLTEKPDVSMLSKQFNVLDSRQSNSQVIEGGVRKTQFLMRFELLPKALGQTEIPSFTASGQSTLPIRIDVVERGTAGAVPRDKVFAEVSLDKDSAYVQSQIVLSLQILDDGSLASVDPPVPVIPDVQVERLSGGDQTIETRNGEEYRVHTWRYALFPQRHGKVEVPRILIPGSVRDPDYGGGLILRSMATRRIQIRTNTIAFEAKEKAAGSTADWWLPVENLNLQHQWSDDIAASKVGEPLTLTLSVTTRGSTSNQIPEFVLPEIDGLKIYPDVPELASQPLADGLTSQRREKWSVIPQRSGELTLPAMQVKWWDITADVEREATIPAQKLVVSANPATTEAAAEVQIAVTEASSLPADPPRANADAPPEQNSPQNALPPRAGLWKWLALFALTGWFVTAVLWGLGRRRNNTAAKKHKSPALQKTLLRELRLASQSGDAGKFRQSLMRWGQCRWPTDPPQGPLDIASRLGSSELTGQLQKLEASLYSQSVSTVSLPTVYNTVRQSLSVKHPTQPATDPLPLL